MEKKIQLLGWACIGLGALAAGLFFVPGMHPRFVMLLTILGFASSSFYTMLNSRHQVTESVIHPGLIGMLLSSIPLIIILYLRFSHS